MQAAITQKRGTQAGIKTRMTRYTLGTLVSFTHKLQNLFINKIRIRPRINLNLIEKCDIQVVIKIVSVMITIAHTSTVNELFHAPAWLVVTLHVYHALRVQKGLIKLSTRKQLDFGGQSSSNTDEIP